MVDYAACPNLLRLFFDQAEKLGDEPFVVAKKDGTWEPTSWRQAAAAVRLLARGLVALGIQRGDRIGLISENRPEWLIADLAIMAAGAITVPAYTTNTVADHRYILANVGAKAVIASTAALSAKAIEAAREWVAARAEHAEAPLAERAGREADVVQQRRQQRVAGRQRPLSLGLRLLVVAHRAVARVLAGHQHRARRRADRRAGVVAREAHAAGGQRVEVRRADPLLAEAAEFAVAEIVGEHEHDVG